MTKIVLEPADVAKLSRVTQAVELCDPSGRVIGRFAPKIDLSGWEPVGPDVTVEELDRRERSGEKSYSTAEVLAHL